MLAGGDALRWLAEAVGAAGSLDRLLREAEAAPPGSGGVVFLPYLVGRGSPRPDSGAAAAFLGLRRAHGRGHLARAVLEGVAFGVREIAGAFVDLGWPLQRLTITGGGAASPLWRRIVAATLGRPVAHARGGSNLGAAVVLAVALGLAGGFDEAVERMVQPSTATPPPDEEVDAYDAAYGTFRDAVGRLGRAAPA